MQKKDEELKRENDNDVKYCPHCGEVNNVDDQFCIKCGKNLNIIEKKKKKIIIPIIVFFLIVLVSGGLFVIRKREVDKRNKIKQEKIAEQESVKEILKSAYRINTLIKETEKNLTNIGEGYCFDIGLGDAWFMTVEDNLAMSRNTYATFIATERISKTSIDDEYKTFEEKITGNDDRYQDLKDAVEKLYSIYLERYDLIIDNSINRYTFSSDYTQLNIDYAGLTDQLDKTITELAENYEIKVEDITLEDDTEQIDSEVK